MLTVQETIEKWKQCRQQVYRNTWNEYFMLQAFLVSTRSLDPQTQHGCIIVQPDKTIVASGYNSFIGGIDDSVLPNLRPEKYPFMIHSEQNAIFSAAKNGHSTKDCIVYVTGPPCNSCFQFMHQAGISKIYYYSGNIATMIQNDEYDTNFAVLKNLSKTELICLGFDDDFSDKINKIKSCR